MVGGAPGSARHQLTSFQISGRRVASSAPTSEKMLTVAAVPEGAINLNVEGRRLTSPIQGFGKMWQKTYQVAIPT